MLLTWCYGLTHNFSLPRATGCLHSSDREKTVSRNARKRYVSERAYFYIPKGEKPRNFMGLEAKSYSTINTYDTSSIKYMPFGTTCRKGNSEICERVSSSIASPCARRWSTLSGLWMVFQSKMALDTRLRQLAVCMLSS